MTGFIDWDAYQDIQRRLAGNIPPGKGAPGTGAVREGSGALADPGRLRPSAAARPRSYYDGERKAHARLLLHRRLAGSQPRQTGTLRVGGARDRRRGHRGVPGRARPPPRCRPARPPPGSWRPATTPRLDQHRRQVGAGPLPGRQGRNAGTGPSIPKTGSRRVGLEAGWERALASPVRRPKPSWPRREAGQRPAALTATEAGRGPGPSATTLGQVWHAPTHPPARTASSCCAP